MGALPKILIVDDDAELSEMLAEFLTAEGFAIERCFDGQFGAQRALENDIDLVVLDVMLPRLGGIEVLKLIRQRYRVPVVMLTAKGDPTDRILGLELGADDYLPKPFEPRELLARIRAVLRRLEPVTEQDDVRLGNLRIVPRRRSVAIGDQPINLTPLEFDLLHALALRPEVIVSRNELAAALGRRLLSFDRSIDMHMVHLRRKLAISPEAPTVLTVRGSGYILTRPESA